jgi:rifampicin phosphotransferase
MTTEANAIPPDFQVEWDDPAHAELEWEWDDMHMPVALSPLAGNYVLTIKGGFDPAYAFFGAPFRMKARVVAGYAYYALDYGVPSEDVRAAVGRARQAYREFAPKAARYWTDEAMPELRSIFAIIDGIDVDGLPGSALADAWDAAWLAGDRVWVIHFITIRGAYVIVEDLADLYERAIPGAAPGEAMTLIQGQNDVLHDVEAGIEAIAALVAARPVIAERIRGVPAPTLDEMGAMPDGAAVVTAIRSFLAAHGHLGQAFDDLAQPSWSEDEGLFISQIASRLADPPEPNAARRARLIAEAEGLAAAVRDRLADQPEELARFEALVRLAREVGPLTEIHNYWIDRMAQARFRALAFRVGTRLVRTGVIDRAGDVLYLDRAEVGELLRAPADRRALIVDRRAEHVRQRTLTPPPILGTPEPDYGLNSRFGGGRPAEPLVDALKGTGASAGVVRGPARVALGPADFGRIQRGDIIVCPSSNPSWVPVFAIAAGLVTITGGVVALAAVVAREFGLPAVVGVARATTKIADGQTIEIDGSAGTVRLL